MHHLLAGGFEFGHDAEADDNSAAGVAMVTPSLKAHRQVGSFHKRIVSLFGLKMQKGSGSGHELGALQLLLLLDVSN